MYPSTSKTYFNSPVAVERRNLLYKPSKTKNTARKPICLFHNFQPKQLIFLMSYKCFPLTAKKKKKTNKYIILHKKKLT